MSLHHLHLGKLCVSFDRGPELVSLVVMAPEGEQSTFRNRDGSMSIALWMALTDDELEALRALLDGRQLAETVVLP